ncbi:MAG: type II toxin-antitoxin system prevent-host-death family antitoxin [Proteobacteria bacterium]|nr:type II toxin-antitoxin system prevent-host-death family antitoxin [Pseudomonadota bacterium]
MASILKLEPVEDMPRTRASEVKTLGWRGVMKAVNRVGKVVVTNHNHPEAVILSAREYGTLVEALRRAESREQSALEELRHRFDERLASLQAPDAGDRLRSVMRGPAKLGGKVKAGAGR